MPFQFPAWLTVKVEGGQLSISRHSQAAQDVRQGHEDHDAAAHTPANQSQDAHKLFAEQAEAAIVEEAALKAQLVIVHGKQASRNQTPNGIAKVHRDHINWVVDLQLCQQLVCEESDGRRQKSLFLVFVWI